MSVGKEYWPSDALGAVEHLEASSPAAATAGWIGAWLLLNRLRRIANICGGAGSLVGSVAAICAYLISRSVGPTPNNPLAHMAIEALSNGAVGSAFALFFWLTYVLSERLLLGAGTRLPSPAGLIRMHSALAPFDGIAREHIRRWSKSPYAS